MRYPDFIKKEDTIGFVAPAFGCGYEPYKSAFVNGIKKLGERGYKSELGPNCYKSDGVGISTNPKDCGEELTSYYLSDNNQALISCSGGELMCETISHVDFEKIKEAKPKWYMGFSDNTNFTFLLTTLCNTASVYGPNAPKFGMEPWHESLEDALKLLEGEMLQVHGYDMWEKESVRDEEHPFEPFNLTETTVHKAFKPDGNGKMEETDSVCISGRLIGGCMDCLVNLTGTRFDKVAEFLEQYKDDGFVWFLESCDLNTFSMRRAMWQLKEAGWFKYCKGFMIGRPRLFDQPMMGLDQYDAVMGVLGQYNVPVIMDCDIGHLSPMMPIISGAIGTVTTVDGNIKLDMRLE